MIDWEAEMKALREDMRAALERREMPRLFKYAEAARLLSISPSKLKGLIRRGIVVPTLLGATKMISLSEIERVATPRGTDQRFSGPPPTARRTRAAVRHFSAQAEAKKLKAR